MRKLASGTLALLSVASLGIFGASAQSESPTEAARLRPPALLVRPDPEKPSLPLRVVRAKANVVVAAGVAATTLDLVFQNDLPRVLEGELVLPLPQGATVSSFALEIDGRLRQASVVDREKGRVVFEEVERRGVDPGLLEWVRGNVFRTRIFPIPAKGTKRLVIGYEAELREPAAGAASYVLPLGFGARLDAFQATVTVHGSKPAAAKGGLDIAFVASSTGAFCGSVDLEDTEPTDLRLEIGAPTARPEVTIERAVHSSAGEPDLIFAVRAPVPELASSRSHPSRVTILWDASGSAAARDVPKERAFLERYLAALGRASVRLVVFSNAIWPTGDPTFEVVEGKCPALLERIAAIRPDGGTRLSCLDLGSHDGASDAMLLFSDGLSNFGEGDPKPARKPVTCITSAPAADMDTLERVAGSGAVVNLAELDASEAVARSLEEPAVLLGASCDGDRVVQVFPETPARVRGHVLTLAGRLRGTEKTKLVLRYGRGAAEMARQELELDPARLATSGRVERIWASSKIASLSRNKLANEAEIVSTAKAHGIVTPFTSLLVLDTLGDYVRYHVLPPADMQEDYARAVAAEAVSQAKSREERLEQVRAKWKARVEWWKKDFAYPADLKVTPAEAKRERRRTPEPSAEEGQPEHPRGSGSGGSFAFDAAPEEPHRSIGGRSRDRGPSFPAPDLGLPQGTTGGGRGSSSTGASITFADDGKDSPDEIGAAPGIALKPWDPKTPYLQAYKKCERGDEVYAAYLEQRKSYATSTAFFLDSADYLYSRKEPELALRILSNLAELQLENAPLLRVLGYRLKEAGEIQLAISVFKEVTRIRPEEPQSFRDLALAEAEAKNWADAIANLEKVVLGSWDSRFPDIDLIALGELNDVIARAAAEGKRFHTIPDDLVARLDCDLRVILTWDADACDMDLWVTEPSGEWCFYGHRDTTIGGALGQDFTQGYGPEEYLLRNAMKGTYKIEVDFYGNRQQVIAGDTTIQVTVIKNYGRKDEERRLVTRRLKERREVLDIAEIAFEK